METFHATGDWGPEQVSHARAESTRLVVPEVEAIIEETWRVVSARPGVNLFDGPMCRLESWRASVDRLDLVLSGTSYKPFLGTNLHHPELADRYGRAVLANAVGVSPALETRDGWLMFGRRNASVAYYPNRIHPFAGAVEPRDALDVFATVRREFAEELGLAADELPEIRCTGIFEDKLIRQPELIFRARTTRARAEVEAGLDRTEHHEAWSVRAEQRAVEAALADVAEMTPVNVAAILLWGRVKFGPTWFESRRRQIDYPNALA